MKEVQSQKSFSSLALTTLLIMTVATSFLFWKDMNSMSKAYADIMQVESISSTTQRQINLASTNEHSARDVFAIGDSTKNALSLEGAETISLITDPNVALLATQVYAEWLNIEEILSVNWNLEEGEETQDLDMVRLALARDGHFKAMTDLSNGMSAFTKDLNSNITQYQFLITIFVFLIGMILMNKGLQTRAELMLSKELAEQAQIDTATGLYNRSRCQELFKGNQSISDQRKPAIMVLDLNDLKLTNDSLGHRVGDELIFTFATILKEATNVHTQSPFIGRYGGDEFIVYYEDISDEAELEYYLKELSFLTLQQNEKENRFQVSYAVGYSYISSDSSEALTARQLFDRADEAMYENKLAGKRAKNPNYDEEKAKGEVR